MESVVTDLLRGFLPAEYGLGTGFIAEFSPNDGPVLSEQVDIVIYDALRGGPIARLDACEVYPIEAVYGYVEVKMAIRPTATAGAEKSRDTVAGCVRQAQRLRSLLDRYYWSSVAGTRTQAKLGKDSEPVSIRSFLFALGCDAGKSPDATEAFRSGFEDATRRISGQAFITGAYVGGAGFFRTVPVEAEDDPERGACMAWATNAFAAFRAHMLHSLARYPRWPVGVVPAFDLYWPDVFRD